MALTPTNPILQPAPSVWDQVRSRTSDYLAPASEMPEEQWAARFCEVMSEVYGRGVAIREVLAQPGAEGWTDEEVARRCDPEADVSAEDVYARRHPEPAGPDIETRRARLLAMAERADAILERGHLSPETQAAYAKFHAIAERARALEKVEKEAEAVSKGPSLPSSPDVEEF